jgi:predicted Zn finger-like uncharacterized protein
MQNFNLHCSLTASSTARNLADMSIEVICPECDTAHKVKDDAAGKKLRCKSCQKVISIPAAAADADADPWDNLDENEAGEELPPIVRPAAGAKKKKSGKSSKARSTDGMPIPIMISIGINGLQIALMAIAIAVNLMSGNFAGGGGGGVRLGIDVMIIQGLMARQSKTRWQAIVLDGIGIGAACLCIVPIVLFSAQQPEAKAKILLEGGAGTALLAGFVIQVLLWITDMVLLLTRSAKDWCSE